MYIVTDDMGRRIDTGRVVMFEVLETVGKPDEMSDEEFAEDGFNFRIEPSCFVMLKDIYIHKDFDVIDDLNSIVGLMKKHECEAMRIMDSDIEGVDKVIQLHPYIGYYD